MRCLIVLTILFATVAYGFRLGNRPMGLKSSLRMSSEEKVETSIVPVDKENVENAAAFTSGLLGLVLAGPVGAIALAAVSNYVVKKENDSGEALRGLGKTVVESYNYLTKINSKYQLSTKVTDSVGQAVSSVEVENEALETIKKTLVTTTGKVDELNKEYDLVGKAKDAIQAARTLSDAALEKIEELNAKYDFVETTKKAAKTAVDTIKEKKSN